MVREQYIYVCMCIYLFHTLLFISFRLSDCYSRYYNENAVYIHCCFFT